MTGSEASASAPTGGGASRRLIDARGAWCPGPLMELIAAIKEEDVGTEIELLSTDPGSRKDVPLWLEKAGQTLVTLTEESGFDRYIVRKTH